MTEAVAVTAAAPDALAAGAQAAPRASVARSFAALASGEAGARLIAFCMTIIVARSLGVERYGAIGFATAVILYLSRVADFGYDLALGVREASRRGDTVLREVTGVLAARIGIGAAVAIAGVAIATLVMPAPDGTVLALYMGTLLVAGASTRWVHIGRGRAGRVAVARLVGELAVLGIVFLVVHAARDVVRVPLAQIAGDALAAALLLAWLWRDGFRPVSLAGLRTFRTLAPSGARLVASSLLGLTIYNSDLVTLRFFRDSAAVGYYAVAYTLVSFCLNMGVAFAVSVLQVLASPAREPRERAAEYHGALAQSFAVTVPLAAGTAILGTAVIAMVFGAGYTASGPMLRALVWSVPVSVLGEIAIVATIAGHLESLVVRLTATGAVLALVLNLILIPPFGWGGAVAATLMAECVRLALALQSARRAGYPLPSIRRFWRPAIAAGVMAAVLAVARLPLVPGVIAGVFLYGIALAALGGLRMRGSWFPELAV